MAHNIMDDKRFYTLRQPAWHKLGYVSQDEQGIMEVIAAMKSQNKELPTIQECALRFDDKFSWHMIPDKKCLTGLTPEHGMVPYAIVSQHYKTVTHQDIARIWHSVLEATPVETLGLLGKGETMFVTCKLPSITIDGDHINEYLQIINPIDGKSAIRGQINSVRIVCQNTLQMALSTGASWGVNVTHKSDPHTILRQWLVETYERACKAVETVAEVGNTLAALEIDEEDVNCVLQDLYVSDYLTGLEFFEDKNKKRQEALTHVRNVTEFLAHSATLAEHQRSTAWGLYNAVAEYEDFGKKKRSAQSIAFGAGAARKVKAFDLCMALTG